MLDRPVKPSRLLARLDAEIKSARTPIEADCKRAERACYLARTGRIAESKAVVDQLHKCYGQRPHIEVSVWVHLAEGLIGHFSEVDPAARQKIQRAKALCTAASLKPMQALTSAWLASMEYARSNMDAMFTEVETSLTHAAPDHHPARARAALAIAQAVHLAGRMDLARVWYDRVRMHTLPEGDDATISALMHGMASLHGELLRQTAMAGLPRVQESATALIGAESNKRFDELNRISSLPALEPLLRAQIHSLLGNFGEACHLYDENLDALRLRGGLRLQAHLLADRAWCRLRMGMRDRALDDANATLGRFVDDTHLDDRAAAHSRLAQVFEALGEAGRAAHHSYLAQQSWATFAGVQSRILSRLPQVSALW